MDRLCHKIYEFSEFGNTLVLQGEDDYVAGTKKIIHIIRIHIVYVVYVRCIHFTYVYCYIFIYADI